MSLDIMNQNNSKHPKCVFCGIIKIYALNWNSSIYFFSNDFKKNLIPLCLFCSRSNQWVADYYAATPMMSTHLLAFVVCDFISREVLISSNVLVSISVMCQHSYNAT